MQSSQPYIFDCYEQDCTRPGLAIEITLEICALLNIQCPLVRVNHSDFGDNLNGTWKGMIRQIMDKEFDAGLPYFNPTTERVKVVDFTMSIYDNRRYLVTRMPEQSNFSPMALFAFNWKAMLLLMSAVFLLGLMTFILDFFNPKRESRDPKKIDDSFIGRLMNRSMDVAALLLQQGPSHNEYHTAAFYIIFSVWGLSCVVLIGVYSSFILLMALAPKQQLPFNDLSSLAKCVGIKECSIVTESLSTSYFEGVFTAESGSLLELREALKINPPKVVPSHDDIISTMLNSKKKFYVKIMSQGALSTVVEENKPCVFYATKLHGQVYVGFPFPRKSKVRPIFDKAIMALQANGVIYALKNKYVGNVAMGEMCKKSSIGSEAMALDTFFGPFLAVIFGGAFGIVILICEKFDFRRKNDNQKRGKDLNSNGILLL